MPPLPHGHLSASRVRARSARPESPPCTTTTTRLAAAPVDLASVDLDQVLQPALLDNPSSALLALAPEAQMRFEPQLDGGALTSLVVVAAVVVLFWLRVWVAVSDRLKRETVERVKKEVLLKRLSGTASEQDVEALEQAEKDQATPVLGPVGAWLRGTRLVTQRDDREEGEQ